MKFITLSRVHCVLNEKINRITGTGYLLAFTVLTEKIKKSLCLQMLSIMLISIILQYNLPTLISDLKPGNSVLRDLTGISKLLPRGEEEIFYRQKKDQCYLTDSTLTQYTQIIRQKR
jgi:hypothetical protein